jgi:hypothetical protein
MLGDVGRVKDIVLPHNLHFQRLPERHLLQHIPNICLFWYFH